VQQHDERYGGQRYHEVGGYREGPSGPSHVNVREEVAYEQVLRQKKRGNSNQKKRAGKEEKEVEGKEEEEVEDAPSCSGWPKAAQQSKRNSKAAERARRAGPSKIALSRIAPSKIAGDSDGSFAISKEITDEIRSWQVYGLSSDESKIISKKYAIEFEDKTFSIRPPKLDSFMSRRAEYGNCLKAVNATEEALISTQLKIMDIAPPLLTLYTRIIALGEGEAEWQVKNAAQAALQQWGRAYHHISQQRRRSVASLVDPTFEYLLSSPSNYVPGKEAVGLLFTDSFLQSMLKEATQDATLAGASAAREKEREGAKKASHRDQPSRVLRPRSEERDYPENTEGSTEGNMRTL
jgi:hypothetical protein